MSIPSPTPLPPPPGEAARALHLPGRIVRQVAAFDRRVDQGIDRLRHPTVDRVMYTATALGDFALVWHILTVARGLRSERDAADTVRASSILGLETVLVNGVIKSFFRRTRPTWDQPRAFRIRRPRSSSFPSGHASSAFTAAGVLSEGDRLRPVYYGVAAVVASSRVYVKIHHASDVIAGAATGVVLARVAKRLWPQPVDGSPFSGLRNRRRS
ncbi:MAG: phosphatase PAP2 family protein [Acidimicrobiia bacterium]|nr:phosphatase PAP2 family protein [Acidimicrobiia bacterium]